MFAGLESSSSESSSCTVAGPFCPAPFNPFRCLSAGSCAHPWDCCLQETLAHGPEPGVGMLVQHCAAFSLLLQCHHPPDCASGATHCAWEYFYSCPSPSFGSFFFFVFSPSASPVSESFFPALSSPEVGWCIYGFIAVPVPEVKRQPWGNPTAGSAAPLDTLWIWRAVLAEITACLVSHAFPFPGTPDTTLDMRTS